MYRNIFVMQKLFNKILVPVDCSSRCMPLLEKAVEIAVQYNCSIHLLHVVTSSFYSFPLFGSAKDQQLQDGAIENRKELDSLMDKFYSYIKSCKKNAGITAHSILKGNWNDCIAETVNKHRCDVVLIGQYSSRSIKINPDKVATDTGVPVITIPLKRRMTNLYAIVIPVTDFLPLRKLMYGIYMASFYKTTIKLLGVENEKTVTMVKYYLEKAYALITDNCNVPVDVEMITAINVAGAVNDFSILHAADLVIVNPGTQTRMPGLLSSLLGNMLQRYSPLPVLTITQP